MKEKQRFFPDIQKVKEHVANAHTIRNVNGNPQANGKGNEMETWIHKEMKSHRNDNYTTKYIIFLNLKNLLKR